jgi:hypothetical protein
VFLTFDEPPDRVVAHSSAGDVDVQLPLGSPAYQVKARSDTGTPSITVRTDPESSRTISATSTAGGVQVHLADS